MEALLLVAEHDGPTMFARIGVMWARGRNAVPLGLRPHFLGDWWIIVTNVGNIAEDENPECFVLTPGEAKRGAVQDEGAPQAFWLPWDYYSKERFRKWDRIGR